MSRSCRDTERKRMARFIQQDGRCYWCRCDLVLTPPGKHIKNAPPNTGTMEHLRDRFHPQRTERNQNREQRLVLACRECNERRGAANQAAAGIEELRQRSGYYKRFLFGKDLAPHQLEDLQKSHET